MQLFLGTVIGVGPLIWFIAALVLAMGEMLAGEFTMLMLAGAALATAGISLAGVPLWAEILTFAAAAFLLLAFVKPLAQRHISRNLVLDTSPKALEGQVAEVVEDVTDLGGIVRLDGSMWSARSSDPTVILPAGERVRVLTIDGTTAVVWKEL